MIAPAKPLAEITERELTGQLLELTRLTGFKRYHTWRSKHSAAGYPDETLVRERLIFLELKTEKGKLTDDQRDWLRALIAAGVEVYVLRPRHLEQIAHVLAARRDPIGGHLTTPRAREAEQQLLDELRKEIDP